MNDLTTPETQDELKTDVDIIINYAEPKVVVSKLTDDNTTIFPNHVSLLAHN